MARPAKVGGLRTTRTDEVSREPEPEALPSSKQGVYQFRSKSPAFRLSLRRRRIERGPDGEKEEVSPRTRDGFDAPLDLVALENGYFETPSKELAEAIIAKAKSLGIYGVGAEIWTLEDEKIARDAALERELRARIESSPEIAAKMGLRISPSEAPDVVLPPPVA